METKIERAYKFRKEILAPCMQGIEDIIGIPCTLYAERFLLAVMLQESDLKYRYQLSGRAGRAGPARGWAQFERNGGVAVVMRHANSAAKARILADSCRVIWHKDAIHRALEGHDLLSVGFARLLLWTSHRALPTTESAAWNEYIWLWRPEKPRRQAWIDNWNCACQAIA